MSGKTRCGCNRGAGNYATAAMRSKFSSGCNTSAGIYAMELLSLAGKPAAAAKYKRGKLCNCCHARQSLWWLQYNCGKLCNCCHKLENLRRLQSTCAGNPATLQYKRGKLCNCCHTQQSLWWLQYKREKLCNWCHARQKLWRLQAREYTQIADTSIQPVSRVTCSLRTIWTLEGVSWTFYTNFFNDKLKHNL